MDRQHTVRCTRASGRKAGAMGSTSKARAAESPGDGRPLHLVTAPAVRPGPGDGRKAGGKLLVERR